MVSLRWLIPAALGVLSLFVASMPSKSRGPASEIEAEPRAQKDSSNIGQSNQRHLDGSVALLGTFPQANESALYVVDETMIEAPAPRARLPHAEDAAVRGATFRGRPAAAVVADAVDHPRDLSYAGVLWFLEPGKEAQRIVDGVVHASRPVVSTKDEVIVARGRAGTIDGERLDDMTVEAIESTAQGPRARVLWTTKGIFLHVIGTTLHDEVLVYWLEPGVSPTEARASVVAINLSSLARRTVLDEIPPYARDFAVSDDEKSLFFVNRDAVDAGLWQVVRAQIDGKEAPEVIHESKSMVLVPTPLGSRGIAVREGDATLIWNDGFEGRLDMGDSGLPGSGVIRVLARHERGYRAGLSTVPGAIGVPFLMRESSLARLVAPAGARMTVLGFVAGSDWSAP